MLRKKPHSNLSSTTRTLTAGSSISEHEMTESAVTTSTSAQIADIIKIMNEFTEVGGWKYGGKTNKTFWVTDDKKQIRSGVNKLICAVSGMVLVANIDRKTKVPKRQFVKIGDLTCVMGKAGTSEQRMMILNVPNNEAIENLHTTLTAKKEEYDKKKLSMSNSVAPAAEDSILVRVCLNQKTGVHSEILYDRKNVVEELKKPVLVIGVCSVKGKIIAVPSKLIQQAWNQEMKEIEKNMKKGKKGKSNLKTISFYHPQIFYGTPAEMDELLIGICYFEIKATQSLIKTAQYTFQRELKFIRFKVKDRISCNQLIVDLSNKKVKIDKVAAPTSDENPYEVTISFAEIYEKLIVDLNYPLHLSSNTQNSLSVRNNSVFASTATAGATDTSSDTAMSSLLLQRITALESQSVTRRK